MGRPSLPKRSRKPPNVGSGLEGLAQEIQHLLALDVLALRRKSTTLLGTEPSASPVLIDHYATAFQVSGRRK
jgi:hypothetical protein